MELNMNNTPSSIGQRLWSYCNVLRDDGVSYGDYVEQLTYLLFLKMDYEQTKSNSKRNSKIPTELNWSTLLTKKGANLDEQDNAGNTPLHLAVPAQANGTVALLLQHGATVWFQNQHGCGSTIL